jgi:nucleoside phosphorylase
MNNILHILINDESVGNESNDPSVFSFFDDLKRPFVQIKNAKQFDYLIDALPDTTEVAIWVHPNASLKKSSNVDTPGEASMSALALDEVDFNVISRYPDDVSKELLSDIEKNAIKLGSLYKEIKNAKKTTIGKLKSNSTRSSSPKSSEIDFAIITALYDDEFQCVSDIFKLVKHEDFKLGDKNIYFGTLEAFPDKKIIAVYQSEVGRTDASSIVTDMIKEFNPRFIFMTGVCGGDSDIPLGSIVVAKFVFTFDKGKITDKGFFRELEFVKIHEGSLRQIRESNDKTLKEVKTKLISNEIISERYKEFNFQELKAIIDPVACSSAVINKENYFAEVIKTIDRKATAVEMESYGIARGAETTNSGKTRSIIIKSVMDNTTGKNDKAKSFASYTSALYLKCLLENGTIK